MSDFLDMGGYGGFVWPAFVVTAVVLFGLLAVSLHRLRSAERALARLQAAAGGARPGAPRGRGGNGGSARDAAARDTAS